jgi:hypothetical protein
VSDSKKALSAEPHCVQAILPLPPIRKGLLRESIASKHVAVAGLDIDHTYNMHLVRNLHLQKQLPDTEEPEFTWIFFFCAKTKIYT